MKPREKTVGEILDQSLGLFSRPSAEQMELAREHVYQRMKSKTDNASHDELLDFEPVCPVSKVPWQALAAVAAAIVIAALIPAAMLRNPAPPRSASAVGKPEDIARKVQYGESIRSNDAAGTVLALPDGSRAEMRSQSELALERADDGVRIRLNQGSVIVTAAKQSGGHLYVQTKDVTVSVVGTVFLVNAEEAGSRVAVIQGEVRVQQGATLKKLLPGEQITTNPVMRSVPMIKEIQWSRYAVAHMALLQQSIVVPSVTQLPAAPAPSAFEVASVKPCKAGERGRGVGRGGGGASPGRLTLPCSPVAALIRQAYLTFANGQRNLLTGPVPIAGGPAWINADLYEINATAEGNPGQETMKGPVLRAILEDRFKLKIHRETREVPVYALAVAKGGPKLQQFKEGSCITLDSATPPPQFVPGQEPPKLCGASLLRGNAQSRMIDLYGIGLDQFSKYLGSLLGRPGIDKTGITGLFDFHLEFAPDESTPTLRASPPRTPPAAPSDPAGPSIFTAIQEQLGLKLEPDKGPGEFLVIDHVERPSEN